MEQEPRQFYEGWAREQLRDPNRTAELRWKAQVLLGLCERAGVDLHGDVLEIGCAEGIVLDELRRAFPRARYYGVDLSGTFVEQGRRLFPEVELRRQDAQDFFRAKPQVDFVVLSDLLEHVPDDDAFLRSVIPHCGHILFKIPVEVCAYDHSAFVRALRRAVGKTRFPPAFGPGHPDGHLRGFTVRSARALLGRNGLDVLAESVETVHQFYGRAGILDLAAALSKRLCVGLFGGAYFSVARTRAG